MVFQIKQREAHLQGREEGLAEGKDIGREQGHADIVRKMHIKGVSVNQIADMCGIPSAEIDAMLAQKDT